MENRKKILIISLAYHPFIGGAEVAVQEITKRLVGDQPTGGFTFDLITCNLDGKQKDEEEINGVKVYRVGKGNWGKIFFSWLAYKKAKELQREENFDVVWAIMANRAGLAALKFKEKFPQVKYVLTLQEGDSLSHVYKRTWFWFWRYKKIYQKADHIQVISKWLESRARKFGYVGKISVIPNGVNISVISQQSAVNNRGDSKAILTVSRLVEKNGVADLIRAFHLLITDYKLQVTLNVIGDGPLKSELQKMAVDLGVADKINFTGSVDFEKVGEFYAQADVFVRPSLSEGLGNVFLEAMAHGVPVIATPVGGIPDFLVDGQTGWFCEPKNPASIAEKIKYVLDDEHQEEVKRVVDNAFKMVEEKYAWDTIAEKLEEILNT